MCIRDRHAIARGAWLLSDAWLYHSLDAGTLLPEAPFETAAWRGARRAREAREAGAPLRPLAGVTLAVVEADAGAHERLATLARAAGATLTAPTRAALCVGSSGCDARAPRRAGTRGGARGGAPQRVRAEWLYDSVSEGEAQPVDNYGVVA